MNFVWKDYNKQYASRINKWLKHDDTYKYTEIDDWHATYINIVNGVDFYYANGNDGEKCHYKLNDDYYCKVVLEKGQLIAVLELYINPVDKSIHINPVVVSPSLQGKGYGTLILLDFIRNLNTILKNIFFTKISVMIASDNIASIKCFEKVDSSI